MSDAWILRSKLVAPVPPAGWLEREFLTPGAPLPPATLLVAGPGYGKTLGLASLAQRAAAAGAMVVWYSLDELDADPATFFHYLVAAIQAQIPQFGPEIKSLLAGDRHDPRLLWRRFFVALAAYNVPALALVLDDCHRVIETDPAVLEALAGQLDEFPPGLHLLLASRRRLPFRLARHQAAERLVLLGPERLRFDEHEQDAFLRGRATDVPPAWIKQAATLDGWPLGLDLLTKGAGTRERPGADTDHLMAFVAEELYDVQPSARRAFMLRAAHLQELTADACLAVFGATDAAEHLADLDGEMMIQRLAGGAGFRFPTYLQAFLQAEAKRTLSATVIKGWHGQAALFYAGQDQAELVLGHQMAGQDWSGAVDTVQAYFPVMLVMGRQTPLERWLAAFPPEVAEREPALSLWRGICLARRGHNPEAKGWYEIARTGFHERDDLTGELKAIVRLCGIALLALDTRLYSRLLHHAQALLPEGRPEDLADLYLMRGMAAERRGDMALMRECNEAVLAIAVGSNVEVATCRGIALQNLFTKALHAGELAAASRLIGDAIALAEAWQFYPAALSASFHQAHLRLCAGETEAAGAFVRTLPAGWSDLLDWHDQGCAMATVGHYYTATGASKDAEDALRRSRAIFHKAGFVDGEKIVAEKQMWLAVQRRQPARVRELFQEIGEPNGENIFDLAMALPYARTLHTSGELQAALKEWQRVVPALDTLGASLHLARAHLYEAATRDGLGDRAGALSAWQQATNAIEKMDYQFLRSQDPALWEELAPLAAPPTVLVGVAAVSQPVTMAEPPLVVVADVSPARPQTAPAGADMLELRLFGTFEVRKGGILLDHWPRRKARLVLAALALYPRGLPVIELAELIGEATDTPHFLASLRTNVMTLRKLLEPALGKREDSRYLHYENDRYMLETAMIAVVDLRSFEEAMAAAERVRETSPDQAAEHFRQALTEYRGNLLIDGGPTGGFEAEREAFRRQALRALFWLADHYEQRGDRDGEEGVLLRAAAIAPCEEEIYVRLMHYHQLRGRPERLRQAYWDCRKALKAALGIMPSPAFEAAYLQLATPGTAGTKI